MTTAHDAFLRGEFNRGFNLINYHQTLQQWGMFIFKHKIWLYNEPLALKTKDGVRLCCSIHLDWLTQELTLEFGDINEIWKVKLDAV